MKKHLILSLLLCFSMTAAKAGTETRNYGLDLSSGWGYSATLTGKIAISFSGLYGEFELTNKITTDSSLDVSEYTSCVIVCSEVNNVQAKVEYTEDFSALGNGDKYPSLSVGTNVITFKTDYGNVKTLALYDNSDDATSSIVIEEAYLVKAASGEEEGEHEAIVYGGNNWGSTYALISPEITYTSKNGEIAIANEDGTPFTLDSSNVDTYNFTVTLAEAAPVEILVKTKYTYLTNDTLTTESGEDSIVVKTVEADLGYPGSISAGETSGTFKVDASNVATHDISNISFMANSDGDYPAVVKFSSIVAEVSGSDITGSYDSSFTLPSSTSDGHTLGGITFGSTTDGDTQETTETTYDPDTHTVTYGAAYGGCGWWLGGEDYSDYEGIEVAFKTPTTDYIQLVVQYYLTEDDITADDENVKTFNSSVGLNAVSGDGQTLYIDFLSSLAGRIREIYIQNGTTTDATLQVLNARLIPKSTDNEAYTYSMNLAGYSMTDWAKTGDSYQINYYTGDEGLGTVDMTFASEDGTWGWPGYGWKDWGTDGTGAFNLAEFDKIELEYTFNGDPGDSWVELTVNNFSDNTGINAQANDYSKTGTITLAIGEQTYTDPDSGETVYFDWTHVGQLVLQASGPCSITVTSIKFIRAERTEGGGTASLDSDDVNLGKTGGTYYISGGTGQTHTVLFPVNSAGTYDIYLADGTTMNTVGRSDNSDAGFTIPRGVTVNLYIEGDATINGSTYGIYAMSGSDLTIYTIAVQSSENYSSVSNAETTSNLVINAEYGIYFLGSNFNVYGLISMKKEDSGSNTYVWTVYQDRGSVSINAKYCGIYFSQDFIGYEIKGTDLNIEVSGNDTDITEDTTIEPKYICGIYNASNSMFCLSVGKFVIDVPGTGTYGTYSNSTSNLGFYFGAGTYVIRATKCVLHHPDGTQYSGGYNYLQEYSDENAVVLELIGPFCLHYDGPYYYNDQWNWNVWSCDGGTGTLSADSENGDPEGDVDSGYSSLPSNVTYQADDQYDYDSPYATISNVTEMEYFNRYLYKGWNTLCLPYDYDMNSTTEVDDDYDGVEARTMIDKVATFGELRPVTTDDDGEENAEQYSYYLSFSGVDLTNNSVLSAGTPYLVHVNSTTTEDNTDEWKVKVHFTSMSRNLKHMYDDRGDNMKTVYHTETLKNDGTISGDSDDSDTYYYKLYNPSQDGKEGDAYFNRPPNTAPVNAFRSYLKLDVSDADAKSLSIVFDDGTTTSIEELDGGVNAENSRVRVYSVDGKLIKVAGASEATKGLTRGVYVVDGKKVVVM